MEVVKVEYTVREDYIETNKENIKAVIEELKSLGDKGVKYFVSNQGNKFIHFAIFQNKEATNIVPNLESFKKFREQLKTGAKTPPVSEDLELVDSSFPFFN
ncbi:hypothetical protein CMI42_02360 [Candidatus Pacearchaeota archaeon]|nr:hypothetical protein [Candidatus Pacearchaeota archaeon]|tara:strand:- start:764 stop:1066 length:303 start_codon:yes stop_codon:yes gene_type:complete